MRVYLKAPFRKKNEARRMGARWDPQTAHWYLDGPPYHKLVEAWDLGFLPEVSSREELINFARERGILPPS